MTLAYFDRRWLKVLATIVVCLLAIFPIAGSAKSTEQTTELANNTLQTLATFVQLRDDLQRDIKVVKDKLATAQSDTERASIRQELDKLEADLRTVKRNLENVATGVDTTKLRAKNPEEFNFQKEVMALLRPAIDEMKEMTAHARQKADLKEEVAYYEERLPVIEQAIGNLERLLKQSDDASLEQSLAAIMNSWQKQYNFMRSELQAAQLQLDKLVGSETSLTEASQSYLKSFFQKRGLYLTMAVLVVLGIVLISRLSFSVLRR